MKQRGLAPILIILLITAAIGGYLVYSGKVNLPQKQIAQTPKVDDTANWKTYTSPKRDYLFMYPGEWDLTSDLTQDFSEVLCRGNQCNSNYNINNFSISETAYKSLEEYIKGQSVTGYEKLKFQGLDAIKTLTPDKDGSSGGWQGSIIRIYVNHIGKVYEIDLNYPYLDKDKFVYYPESLPNILATFKFLDQK